MNIKSVFQSLYYQANNYNLFIPEENDYDEEPKDPIVTLKHQKYSTRLYVLLLLVCMYVLFYATMMELQVHTIVITDIDEKKFEKLYLEYDDTLSCPCSTITISYQQFVSNVIRFHPVCTSFFVSQQWIEALYLSNRSSYGIGDFRKTASSQFQLLSSLCSLSQEITLKNEIDLNNNQFISISLLPQSKVESEVNATIQFLKSTLSTRILSFIDYFRIVIQANNFIMAADTNVILYTMPNNVENIFSLFTAYAYEFIDGRPELMKFVFCGVTHTVTRASIDSMNIIGYWKDPTESSTIIRGFFTGCSPFESLLQSTLDCLYETNCLQLLNENFPNLNQMNLNLSNYVLLSNKTNISIYEHFSNSFIDNWTTTLNYTAYLQNCNPSKCTYTIRDKINYSYAITLFISLYGGLILILRSISSFLINIILKLKCQSTNRISICRQKFLQWMKQLNLFKTIDKRTENDIKRQKLNTRIYLILLIIMIIILILFNLLSTEIVTKSVPNPSLNTYIHLQKMYSNTLTCPCSTMTIPYHKFMSLSSVLHQICSSDLITDRWISTLEYCSTEYIDIDWRNRVVQQFRLLSKLCQLANQTVSIAVKEFLLQSFIVSNIFAENDFHVQIKNVLDQFYQSTTVYFRHLIDAINLHIQVDQPFMLKFTPGGSTVNLYSMQFIQKNTTDNQEQQLIEIALSLTSLQDIDSNLTKCFCSTDLDCQTTSAIFYIDFFPGASQSNNNHNVTYIIPGSSVGCSEINSLLLSTFECFYSDSICFPTVRHYLQQMYMLNVNFLFPAYSSYDQTSAWFHAKPLVYNSTLTSFYRNSSILTIIKNLLIERWNPSYSYNAFYQLCSPSYCIYQEKIHTNNMIGISVILISTIGGLIISIHLITPYLVIFIIKLISIIIRKKQTILAPPPQQQQQTNISQSLPKLIKQKIIIPLYNILITLNIFPRRVFGSHIDGLTAKYYGRLTTRLYFILLIISFVILTIYTISQQHMIVKEFNKPSLETYNKLIQNYGDQLKCSCSSISSTYRQFIEIKPIFHEICSSIFTSNEMINNLTKSLSSNVLIYEKRDYRRWILSHIQYLRGLCQISFQLTNNSIGQFLSTLFLSKDLLSKYDFNEHINVVIERTKQNAPDNLNTVLFLIRNINFGNAIISTYGTNFQYIANRNDIDGSIFVAEAEIYDNNCSCSLYLNCTSQAYFIETNSSKNISIKGLKIGCTPTEAFLSSTLECFYDVSCVNMIKQYTNYSYSLEPLSNQSQINYITINKLVQNLFIDHWLTTKNFSSYYQQCSPQLCSYTYIEKVSLIYIVSFLLGLQGGLTIVLKWICPKIIQFVLIMKRIRKKRSKIVTPTITVDNVNICNTTTQLELNQMSRTSQYLKIALSCLLITILIALLTIFSIYIAQHTKETTSLSLLVSSTDSTTTININMTTISTSTRKPPTCNFKFDAISIPMPESYYNSSPTVIGDFNNDNRLDIAYVLEGSVVYFNDTHSQIIMMLGNENGTFEEPIISYIDYLYMSGFRAAIDFNHDNRLDIILEDKYNTSLHVHLGNGDGTFYEIIFFVENCDAIYDMSISNLNNDVFLDFAIVCLYTKFIIVIFGNANGTPTETLFLNESMTSDALFSSVEITNLNNDNYEDIVVTNGYECSIVVFLGYGNGSFDKPIISVMGRYLVLASFVVGDFNNDKRQDLIFLYQLMYTTADVGLIFGYNDGTFDIPMKLNLTIDDSNSPIVSDLNGDSYLDLIVATNSPYTLNIWFGDGNGNFELYTIFSSEFTSSNNHMIPIDFNGDGYQDIFVTSEFGLYMFLNTGRSDNDTQL